MRLWSLHPIYLDPKGLVALWREGLLAQKVLAGKTRGYRHHPEVLRFLEHPEPLVAIGAYLREVFKEATRRGYSFDRTKILHFTARCAPLPLSRSRLAFEKCHLMGKLWKRNRRFYNHLVKCRRIRKHPFFGNRR